MCFHTYHTVENACYCVHKPTETFLIPSVFVASCFWEIDFLDATDLSIVPELLKFIVDRSKFLKGMLPKVSGNKLISKMNKPGKGSRLH